MSIIKDFGDSVTATERADLAEYEAKGWEVYEDDGVYIANCPGFGQSVEEDC